MSKIVALAGMGINSEKAREAAQKEITAFVRQNPGMGHYECKAASGQIVTVPAAVYRSGKIAISVTDPVVPSSCKVKLNLKPATPGAG